MAAMQQGEASLSDFKSLIEIDLNSGVFGSNWAHCDQISTYVARMVSHNRSDSLLYANLLSSALNELLETVFRMHRRDGSFLCAVKRRGPVDRVEITVSCQAEHLAFYRGVMNVLEGPDVAKRYRETLVAAAAPGPQVGLLELAVDYAAKLSVDEIGDGFLRLTADLALEEQTI
ncbi:MAG TPA: ubiquinone biosynthesis methyltransferase UbiE [Rhizobiaceae bacterium]|nr:ubiquinone biosynthesis methyltransferase UbiE [Rhizobiaceae bacterium]